MVLNSVIKSRGGELHTEVGFNVYIEFMIVVHASNCTNCCIIQTMTRYFVYSQKNSGDWDKRLKQKYMYSIILDKLKINLNFSGTFISQVPEFGKQPMLQGCCLGWPQ